MSNLNKEEMEWDINKDNEKERDILVTGAIVFKGDVKLMEQLVLKVKNNGQLIYRRVASPNRKLWIQEE